MAEAQDQLPSPESLQRGYEAITVSNLGLLIFLICFLLVGVLVHWSIWSLYKHYSVGMTRAADMPRSAIAPVDTFADPRLQPSQQHPYLPKEDLADWRQDQQKEFDQLGWQTNKDTGLPIIPDNIVSALAYRYASTAPSAKNKGATP